MKKLVICMLALMTLTSCVSKKKLLEVEGQRDAIQASLKGQIQDCEQYNNSLQGQINSLNSELQARNQALLKKEAELSNKDQHIRMLDQQMDFVKNTNQNLLDRLSDLSVINRTGAESIQRSLEAINEQNKYIKDLTGSIQRKDSLNLVLVMNLKRSLADIDDEDVQVEVKKGVVYISLSDKMLFRTGSATINPRAEEVLGKVARVLNDHAELDILVEGHTDTVPIKN